MNNAERGLNHSENKFEANENFRLPESGAGLEGSRQRFQSLHDQADRMKNLIGEQGR